MVTGLGIGSMGEMGLMVMGLVTGSLGEVGGVDCEFGSLVGNVEF